VARYGASSVSVQKILWAVMNPPWIIVNIRIPSRAIRPAARCGAARTANGSFARRGKKGNRNGRECQGVIYVSEREHPDMGLYYYCVFGISRLPGPAVEMSGRIPKSWYNNGVHTQGEILSINT
jgi:hypothetical protein